MKMIVGNLFLLLLAVPICFADPENEWFIEFDKAYDSDGDGFLLEGFTLQYNISKGKTLPQLEASIMDQTCLNEYSTDAVKITKSINADPNLIYDEAKVKLDFNLSLLEASPIWSRPSNETGIINCCVQTELLHIGADETLSVSFINTELTLKVNFTAGFIMEDIELVGNETTVQSLVDYDVDACVCSSTGKCIDNPVLGQGDKFEVCISPKAALVDVESVESLSFFQDGVNKYIPIMNGASNGDTTIETGGHTSRISTRMIPTFFESSPLAPVSLSGEVILGFDQTRRSLTKSRENEKVHRGSKRAYFNIEVKLQPSHNADLSVSSAVSLWMAEEEEHQPNSVSSAGAVMASSFAVLAAFVGVKKYLATKAGASMLGGSAMDNEPLFNAEVL